MNDFTTNPNKGIKIKIDFPDISHSEAEKRVIAKFKLLHEKDDPKLTLKLILTFFVSGALVISLICAIIINHERIENIPTGVWTIFTLFCIAFIVWFMINRQAKKDLKEIKTPKK